MALRLTTINDCCYSAFIFRKEQMHSGSLVVSARKTKHPWIAVFLSKTFYSIAKKKW